MMTGHCMMESKVKSVWVSEGFFLLAALHLQGPVWATKSLSVHFYYIEYILVAIG